ncbi:MAG TPA: nuclear transport factor 2 family protein [Pyrinomonadaceae bacterium]|nr:nuclear transport factor 2 family protein [Pyrinomonadaceae bacterium]
MKKLLVLVCFLLTAICACTPQPTGNKDVVANANQPAETKSTAMPSEAEIIAKEKATWDAIKQKNWDSFASMMASDFVEVLDMGVHDKATALTGVKDLELTDITYADWKMTPIDKDAVILTYTATLKAKFKGETIPEGPYRDSAVWVNRNGQWMAIFFQETLAAKEPQTSATPAEKKAPAASPAASAKSAETSSDTIANEKIVWDLFKSRNFDGFAALLAPEFVEIEPTGFYDKAGSVKGVEQMDATGFELSDWKATKLDDDAGIVTYTVAYKGDKEYHSTIWANRNGKWMALLHHGTPAAKPK